MESRGLNIPFHVWTQIWSDLLTGKHPLLWFNSEEQKWCN